MAKKGVKKARKDSKKKVLPKKKAVKKKVSKTTKTTVRPKLDLSKIKKESSSKLDVINEKLDLLIKEQEDLMREEHKIEQMEEKELWEDRKLEDLEEKETEEIGRLADLEAKEVDELRKLEDLEQKIKTEVEPHPLARITYRDFFKGSIGAFIGLVVHYTFIYGLKVAEHLTFARASFLYGLSFLIGAIIMYATGFRKVTQPRLLIFWPLRLSILYLTALLVSIIVLYIFQPGYGLHFEESYVQTAAVMISAIIGATTADLIGRE